MEFRFANEPLDEEFFDVHVSNLKSYIGTATPSSSYYFVTRYSFDDNTEVIKWNNCKRCQFNQIATSPADLILVVLTHLKTLKIKMKNDGRLKS